MGMSEPTDIPPAEPANGNGRVAHTAVQTLTGNVKLRGQVSMVNFVGVAFLIAHLAQVVVFG